MYYLKNITSETIVTLGEEEIVLHPQEECYILTEVYDRLIHEIKTLTELGKLYYSIYVGKGDYSLKERVLLTGTGKWLTPAQVFTGIIRRIKTKALVGDILPTASEFLAAMPGEGVGTHFKFYYSYGGDVPYVKLACNTGIEFWDDWWNHTNSVDVRIGNAVTLEFLVVNLTPPTIYARVITIGGSLSVDRGLAGRFSIRNSVPVMTPSDVQYDPIWLTGGRIFRFPAGATRNDLIPPAGDIYKHLNLPINGSVTIGSFLEFTIKNIDLGVDNIVLNPMQGITFYDSPVYTIAPGEIGNFLLVFTNIIDSRNAVAVVYKK